MKSGVSSNLLKIIAAVCMVIDHLGYMYYPSAVWMRIIGRISLPIFAFFIAEGCFYTKNRLKYFSLTFGLGVICQVVYFIAMKSLYMCILITFSLAILLIFSYQDIKNAVYRGAPFYEIISKSLIFIATIISVYYLNKIMKIDYGFYGCVLPLFMAIVMPTSEKLPLIEKNRKVDLLGKINLLPVRLLLAIYPLYKIAINGGALFYYYAPLALLLLLLYSGERGKLKMKYFFYIFYPLHLVALQGISLII